MSDARHWDGVYGNRGEEELTWFEARPEPSFSLVSGLAGPEDAVLDVGGGASRLVDALLEAGYRDLTVLDLSARAIGVARARLGARAEAVTWVVADVTRWHPARHYRLWHDRAVFHFLTGEGDRAACVAAMAAAVAPGGHAVIATFADDGPERCSGLPVVRYAPEALAAELERHAPGVFRAERSLRHDHVTPRGAVQKFQTSVFRRVA